MKKINNINYYKKNLQALKKRNPGLAERVERCENTSKYKVSLNHDKKSYNLVIENDSYYYDKEQPLYDVKVQLDSLAIKNSRMCLFLGMGLGYELIYYMQHMAKKQQTKVIFVVEKELEIFALAMFTTDLVDIILHNSVHLIIGEKAENLYPQLFSLVRNSKNITYIKAMNPVYHTSAMLLNRKYYLEVVKVFKDACVQALNFIGNDPDDSLIGLRHMFDNINEIINNPGINKLKDSFKGKPAVVVSTGPSLNKNKELLKGLEDKALIVAVDASLKVMMNLGVKPHLVTSLERVPKVKELIEGYDEKELEDVYFAACPVITNEVYNEYKGPRIIVYRTFAHFKWLDIDRGMLQTGASAGNMAFKVAEYLGCDPIILIGQDLSLSRDGYTHAKGAVLGEKQEGQLKQGTLEVMGNDGEPITTTTTLYQFLKDYERDLATYKGRCINATEGGARIEGSEVQTFKEAIDQYIREDIEPLSIIREKISDFKTENSRDDHKRLLKKLAKAIDEIDQIVDMCHEGLDLIEKHKEELEELMKKEKLTKKEEKRTVELYSSISKPKAKMQNFSDVFQLLIIHIVQSIYIKFEIDMNEIPSRYDSDEHALAEISLRQEKWYGVINNISLIIIEELKKAEITMKEKSLLSLEGEEDVK